VSFVSHCLHYLPPQRERISLHWASASGHSEVAQMLLLHGADVAAIDEVSVESLFAQSHEGP